MKKLKIAGIVIGAVFIIMIIAMIILVVTVENALNVDKGNAVVILPGAYPDSKKAIIVFQPSFGGATGIIANEIGRGLNETGFEVMLNHPGEHLSNDLSDYDVIFFGSPVYAAQISDVLLDNMQRVTFSENAKVILFITGLRSENELELMNDIPLNDVLYAKVKFYANDSGFVDAFNYAREISKHRN